MTQELFDAMRQSVIDGDATAAGKLAEQALAEGIDPLVAIDEAFVPGIRHVGEQFRCGDLFLPDMMLAARAMQTAIAVLEPEMIARASQRKIAGRVVIGTVQGDIHEIGKNLVGMMLTANGFEVHDLGVDVSPEQFVEKAKEVGADLIGVSALLTTTMTGQRTVVEALATAGLRPGVKVMVGGAPVTKAWADEIGADGYGEDAVGAVGIAQALVGAGA
ncbi:MAG TPA: corrinoid protein [Candidatus Limnocylindrales bacterium]|nr:corrinoid protein [Candidatus Limnocylindrales bacterium]